MYKIFLWRCAVLSERKSSDIAELVENAVALVKILLQTWWVGSPRLNSLPF